MPNLPESEISQVEWQVRQLHEKIRTLIRKRGGDSSHRAPTGHLDAAISGLRDNLAKQRSTPAGVSAAPVQPAEDYAAETSKLREAAIQAKRGLDQAQSATVKLNDELTALNTEKMRRLARLERLEETIKARRINLEGDLHEEEEELRDIKNKRRPDAGTRQLKRQLARKKKQLAGKEIIWGGFSRAKQQGALTEGGRKKEEQALKSEVRGLKAEVRTLEEQLKKSGRVSETASGARVAGQVQRQLGIIAEIKKELADSNKDLDRERKEHDQFLEDSYKREQAIKHKLARLQEDQQRSAREAQDQQRKQQVLRERQRQQSSPDSAGSAAPAIPGNQVGAIEQQIKELESQKAQAEDEKSQIERMEMDLKVLTRDVQMLQGSVARAEPQVMVMMQDRLRRIMNDFDQAKEGFKELTGVDHG